MINLFTQYIQSEDKRAELRERGVELKDGIAKLEVNKYI